MGREWLIQQDISYAEFEVLRVWSGWAHTLRTKFSRRKAGPSFTGPSVADPLSSGSSLSNPLSSPSGGAVVDDSSNSSSSGVVGSSGNSGVSGDSSSSVGSGSSQSSASSRIKRVREEQDNEEDDEEEDGEGEDEGVKPEHALPAVPTGEHPYSYHLALARSPHNR